MSPVEKSAARCAILSRLALMTSKHSYAVATLVVSTSLLLAGCAPEDTAPARPASSPTVSASPTTTPLSLSVQQGKAISLLSQRATGNVYPGAPRLDALDWEVCGEKLSAAAGATWLTGSSANPNGDTKASSELAKVTLGGAYSVVTVLEGAAERETWDARLKKWATGCTDPDGSVTPSTVATPGVDASFTYTQIRPKADLTERHVSAVVARVGNVGVICWLAAKDPATAASAAATCARDTVQGSRSLADLASASGPLGARAVLASVVARPKAKSEVTFDPQLTVGPPCGPMKESLMTSESAFATFRPSGTDMYEPATASAAVTAMKDPMAAKARVAQALTTFGGCTGRYTYAAGTRTFPARVLGLDDVAFGDGGFAIRDEVSFGADKPQPGYTAIFSVGRFVVQVDQWRAGYGRLVAQEIAEAAA
ncbi:hypothetical protein GCM10022415_29700 [Knoellia locipacati]|uniref:Uncharacterized protein n=1 Tax=Knoellia locipacati TaxID=882824 RepID=A0A512T4T2_9MICO|nr:hypothetical protein KLO01_32560 [Knoellia locipacati]